MPDFLNALEYGVLGLCAIALVLVGRFIQVEQRREGAPRKGLLQACYVFMGFSIAVLVISGILEFMEQDSMNESKTDRESKCQEDLEQCSNNVLGREEDLRELGESSISLSDLLLMSQDRFKEADSSAEALPIMRMVLSDSETLNNYRKHYAYRLFELESKIPGYGKNINTSIRGEHMEEVYSLIQIILRDIRYYQGPINGDQELTYAALVQFQKDYNDSAGRQHFDSEEDFGFFGYKTLEAVRSYYRTH